MRFCILHRFCKATLRFMLFIAAGVIPLAAQSMSIGFKAGAPVTDPFILNSQASAFNNYTFTTQRYTLGPSVEFGLPHGLAFEGDALYRRLTYASNPFGFDTFRATTSANSWEFPLLLKREFFGTSVRPYGDAGLSLRHIQGTTSFSNGVFNSTQDPLELIHPWSVGFAAGGGAAFAVGPIKILPEIRYTRWASHSFDSSNGVLGSNLNSVDFLIGVKYSTQP